MSKCVFCPGMAVLTTNSTTPSEAFPFLCAQLGVNPSQGRSLCATCHSTWEEVTLLYTNMQGLVNLMGRRVGQLRQKLRNDQLPDTGGKNGKRKRMATATTKEPPAEEMLNWWYPSMASGNLDRNPTTTTSLTSPEVNDLVNVKSEAFEEVGLVDEGGSGDEMEMEDIEIIPEDEDNDNDEESADSDDEDDGDPSYDPLASSSSFCNRTRARGPSSSSSTPGKSKTGTDNDGVRSCKTMAQAVFDLIPAWTPKRQGVLCKEGFSFHMKKIWETADKITWVCTQNKESKCQVQLYSTKDLNNLTLIVEYASHNHPPDHVGCERRKAMSKLMLDAASCNDPAKDVIARHVAQMEANNPGGEVNLPNQQSIMRGIRSMRVANGTQEAVPKVVKKKDKKEVVYYLPPPVESQNVNDR